MPNQTYYQRCQSLLRAIDALSTLGVVVRQVQIDANPPVVWVFPNTALYRAQGVKLGKIADLGCNQDVRTKVCGCHGCEVRWLETHSFIRARQAMQADGGRP